MPGIDDAIGVQFAVGQDFHDHILTDWYRQAFEDGLNNVTPWHDLISGSGIDTETVGGKYLTWPAHVGRGNGQNFMDHEGYLPDPDSQKYDTFTERPVEWAGRIKLSHKSMARARKSAGAYMQAVNPEMQGMTTDMRIEHQRALCNDGSGRLAEVVSVATDTLTLRLHSGVQDSANCTSAPTQWLRVGMRLLGVQPNGTSIGDGTVVSIDSATQVTLGAGEGASFAANDWLVRVSRTGLADETASLLSSGYRKEFNGLEAVYDDRGVLNGNGLANGQTGSAQALSVVTETDNAAGYQGLPVNTATAYSFNQGIVVDAGTNALDDVTDENLQLFVSQIEEQNNGEIDFFLCSYGVYNNYLKSLTPDKRYVNTQDLKGGHTTIAFNGLPFYKDKDVYKNRIYAVDQDCWSKVEVEAANWLDMDGSIWNRVKDKAAYEAAIVGACQYITKIRDRCGGLLIGCNEN